MKLISRKDAISIGAKKYFTGKPCKNGHLSERYPMGSECQECVKMRVYSERVGIKAIRSQLVGG